MAKEIGVTGTKAAEKDGQTSWRLFPRESSALRRLLKANLVFLIGLAAISFFLPLSESERWFVLSAATSLGAVNWALVERVRAK